MNKILPSILLSLCLILGQTTFPVQAQEKIDTTSNNYVEDSYFDDDYTFNESTESEADPFKKWNKPWHNVNDYILIDIAKPVHKAYSNITTSSIRNGFENFRKNLKTPQRMINALLQGEFAQCFIELGRFIINTTTSLGFADVAAREKTSYPYTPENLHFGYTLATWGVPQGPYVVLPLFGPSTVREAIGILGDSVSNVPEIFLEWYVTVPREIFLAFNNIDKTYVPYETITQNAIDPYVAIKNAYLNNLSYKTSKKIP